MDDYKTLFEHAKTPMIILDSHGGYVNHNQAYRTLMGYDLYEELNYISPEDVSPLRQADGILSSEHVRINVEIAKDKGYYEFVWMHKEKNGSEFLSMVLLEKIEFGGVDCFKASIFDLDEENKIKRLVDDKTREIHEKNDVLEAVFNNGIVGMLISDEHRVIIRANNVMAKILKCDISDIVNGTMRKFVFDDESYIQFGIELKETLSQGSLFSKRMPYRAIDGSVVWCKITGNVIGGSEQKGMSNGIVWVIEDVTEKKLLEEELEEQYRLAKDSNPLTGLPGNNSIKKQLLEAVEMTHNRCLMYIDIDNFKSYNDRYGFVKGDGVLLGVANILRQIGSDYDLAGYFVGNVGGDDFVVITHSQWVNKVADEIIRRFDQSVEGYYSEEDVQKGGVMTHSRGGEMRSYPLMSISIASSCLEGFNSSNYLEVIDLCSALKAEGKSHNGSIHIKNRM